MTALAAPLEAAFSPDLTVADPATRAWLRQATLRLRREVAWRWHEREDLANGSGRTTDSSVMESLDLTRHWTAKQAFFRSDVAASYLSGRLADDALDGRSTPVRWRLRDLELDAISSLALALGLLARADAAAGPVFGACLGDARRTEPTLALVQRLGDHPEQTLPLADPSHPLWRLGLIQPVERTTQVIPWDVGYGVPPLVAAWLLSPSGPWPASLSLLDPKRVGASRTGGPESTVAAERTTDPVGDRLRAAATSLRVVPIEAPRGSNVAAAVAAVARSAGRRVLTVAADAGDLAASGAIHPLLTLGWLADVDLFLTDRQTPSTTVRQPSIGDALTAAASVPITVFLRAGRESLSGIPRDLVLPTVAVPRLGFAERVDRWHAALGRRAGDVESSIAECSRRFRFEGEAIDAIGAGLAARSGAVTRTDLFAACRASLSVDIGGLAQSVTPRFGRDELVLPPEQRRQFDEIERAMRSLTEVHYGWGTARAWNEAGISVLFAGPSGTGKTMAAEVLAVVLDIPMYRVNLAQVVDKFIGETEKNLERIFDTADASDTILFFDEADALFGRRTEVRDAHDRYANLEVSYLLERMERFKGLAILATNRRGDLDEAFLRRLRYIVDFPIPDAVERRRIWASVLPPSVEAGDLDLDFLARQFQLTGGNIRSAVLNACLQTAADAATDRPNGRPVLRMEHVLVAIKREHEKFQRALGPTQFGAYAPLVEGLHGG